MDVYSTWSKVRFIIFSSIGKIVVRYDVFQFFQIRNPGDDEILDMTSLLPELRDRILAAADVRSFIRN